MTSPSPSQTLLAPWKVLESRTLLSTPHALEVSVEVVELPDGRVVDDYYQIASPDSAILFAETVDGKVIALRHYMHGARRVAIGLPGGRVSPGEDPVQAACRELLEETGYEAETVALLGRFTRNANQGAGAEWVIRATGCRMVAEPDAGDLEELEIILMDRDAVREALFDGSVAIGVHAAVIALGLLAP